MLQRKKSYQFFMFPLEKWAVLLEDEELPFCQSRSPASNLAAHPMWTWFVLSHLLPVNFGASSPDMHEFFCSAEILMGGSKGPPDKVSLSFRKAQMRSQILCNLFISLASQHLLIIYLPIIYIYIIREFKLVFTLRCRRYSLSDRWSRWGKQKPYWGDECWKCIEENLVQPLLASLHNHKNSRNNKHKRLKNCHHYYAFVQKWWLRFEVLLLCITMLKYFAHIKLAI